MRFLGDINAYQYIFPDGTEPDQSAEFIAFLAIRLFNRLHLFQ